MYNQAASVQEKTTLAFGWSIGAFWLCYFTISPVVDRVITS